ncbi:MAG: tRNA dihydrouridine synthase DusB [Clostridia bacterium]|nr:tRNA dihydrouridine synthase DusB [Clostridia bacterium]
MYLKKLKIGNVELNNNILLAPLAGITDRAFRLICEKYNPGLVCTEMISAKGLYYDDKKTEQLLNMKDEKRPIAVQIFGSDVESMGYAAEYVSKYADIIDINMGCPAPKVVKNGDGSKLLLDLEKARAIIEEVVKRATVPVTVKFRKGWDVNNIVAVEMAKICEEAGASAITIHGRTRSEFYSGTADWDIIRKVKESVSIPVIGNGDVKSAEDVKRMFDETHVDGIMIGRGTLGNPWIFKQIEDELNGKEFSISNQEKLDIILEHLNYMLEDKPERVAVVEMRKHISWYIKNTKDASKVRDYINQITDKDELIKTLTEYFNSI